jgi:hypothetical protein
MTFVDTHVDKILKVLVKYYPSFVKFPEGIQSVSLEMCMINEIESCVDDMNQSWFCQTR